MTKMTNVKALATVLENATVCEILGTEVVEKLEKIKASYEKKSATKGERKPTERQLENEGIKAQILEIALAEPNYLFRIDEFISRLGIEGLTNQRVSQILRQMYTTDGTIERIEEKRKVYFKAVVA